MYKQRLPKECGYFKRSAIRKLISNMIPNMPVFVIVMSS